MGSCPDHEVTVTASTSLGVPDFGPAWVLRLVARGRLLLLVLPILTFIGVFLYIRWHMPYSAEMVLRPQGGSQQQGRLNGLAAQFGVVLPGAAAGDPIRFHSQLITSREVLTPVVIATYQVAKSAGSSDSVRGNLLDLLRIQGATPVDRQRRGIERLRQMIAVGPDLQAALIGVRVTSAWPELSLAISQRLIESLNDANISRQQVSAEAELKFVGDRVSSARAQLDSAERRLEGFMLQNRQYANSPALTLEHDRVMRLLDLRQQVYVTLSQSYEQARLDAVRDTPTIVVVDRPEGSVKEAGRPVRDGAVWAVTVAGMVLLFLLARDALTRFRMARPNEYAAALSELRRLFRPGRGGTAA